MITLDGKLMLVGTWLEHLMLQGRRPHTIKAYRRSWLHLGQWYQRIYNEVCDPARLMARDIRDWKSYQQSVEKAAPSTINQRLVAIFSFYKWALARDQVTNDPTLDIATIRLPRRQPKSLSRRQLRQFLRAVHNGGSRRDIAIVEMLVGTGLRVGELLQLQVEDIVLRERSGWVIVHEGKRDGYREVPLIKEVRQALNAYLGSHFGHLPNDQIDQLDGRPLWWGKHGPLTHRSSILRILQRYALRTQLDSISPHMLRHTFASNYLQANPDDLRGLAALLGHSDLNTVMIYTEPTQQEVANRMERMGNI